MNWELIKNKYPIAFKKLKSDYHSFDLINPTGWDLINEQIEHKAFPLRHLYDWFDKQEIIVSVGFNPGMGFRYSVTRIGRNSFSRVPFRILERSIIENLAFETAFYLLERELYDTVCKVCGQRGHKECRQVLNLQ